METLKQRTIDGTRYTLERKKADAPGKRYEYQIVAGRGQGGRTKVFNPNSTMYRRTEARKMFNEIVTDVQRTQAKARERERQNEQSGGGGFGFDLGFGGGDGGSPTLPGFSFGGGGGGGPTIPGFGMESDDDEEDDEFRFPWM